VPKRSRRRSSGSRNGTLLALIALFIFAAVVGSRLLRPTAHHVTRRVSALPAAPQPPPPTFTRSPTTTAAPNGTPSPTGVATPVPAASSVASPNPNGIKLALIVDDCGQWIATERGFIALDIPLTMSVLPDVPYTGEVAREASQAGKGVMLHLPMETISGLNPGAGEVTTKMSDPQIVAQVKDDLAQVPLARGVNNHEGSKASADPRVMRAVIGVLADRGDLFFIDSRTSAASVGEQTAETLRVPTAARDVFLDNRADVAYSEEQLREAAAIAQRNGSAIAIGHPRPTTLAAVRAMIPQLEARGIEFVLVQALATSASR
jgi:polysaccharide deacetylase 2 family uncharacterized protein YibQ